MIVKNELINTIQNKTINCLRCNDTPTMTERQSHNRFVIQITQRKTPNHSNNTFVII